MNLPHFFQKIQVEDVEFRASISESVAQRVGGVINKILDDLQKAAVGTVEMSILTEAQFQSLKGETWVLADGRNVSGSVYHSTTGRITIPDLRGNFLRGAVPLAVGNQQFNANLSHSHTSAFSQSGALGLAPVLDTAGGADEISTYPARVESDFDFDLSFEGGNENRPRNVTINHFIKIN